MFKYFNSCEIYFMHAKSCFLDTSKSKAFLTLIGLSISFLITGCGGGSDTTTTGNNNSTIEGLLSNFDEATPLAFTAIGSSDTQISSSPSGGTGKALQITRNGGEKYAGAWLPVSPIPSNQGPQKVSARVYSPTAGIQMAIKLEYGQDGFGTGDVLANEVVQVGWQTLTWTFKSLDATKIYNRLVLLPNLGKLGSGQVYYFDDLAVEDASQTDIAAFTASPGGDPSALMGSGGAQSMPREVTNDLHDFISAGDAVFAADYIGTLDGNNRHASWVNASSRGVAKNGNIGFFQDALLDGPNAQITTTTGWVSGRIDGPASVPNFFRVFVFKKPDSAFSNSYMGMYVNAPNNGHIDASSFGGIKFKLWGPAEMYQKSFSPNLQMILSGPRIQGCTTLSGGTELIQDFSANQKLGAGSTYQLALSNFTVNGLCGNDTNQTAITNVLSQLARVAVKVSGDNFNFQEPLPSDSSQFATGINFGGVAFSN